METVNKNEHIREPGTGESPVPVIFIEDHSGVSFLKFSVRKDGFPPLKGTCIGIYDYTTGPYNVTGGANVEIAFVLLQDGSFFISLEKGK